MESHHLCFGHTHTHAMAYHSKRRHRRWRRGRRGRRQRGGFLEALLPMVKSALPHVVRAAAPALMKGAISGVQKLQERRNRGWRR